MARSMRGRASLPGSCGSAVWVRSLSSRLSSARSVDVLTAVLGVWKAGAAYLPIEPDQPAERIGFLLEDSAAAVLIGGDGLLGELPAGLHAHARLGRRSDPGPAGRLRAGAVPAVSVAPGALALRDLHLRLHRAAQGCGGPAIGACQLRVLGGRVAIVRRRVSSPLHSSLAFDLTIYQPAVASGCRDFGRGEP